MSDMTPWRAYLKFYLLSRSVAELHLQSRLFYLLYIIIFVLFSNIFIKKRSWHRLFLYKSAKLSYFQHGHKIDGWPLEALGPYYKKALKPRRRLSGGLRH